MKQSNATDITPKIRVEILERDKYCVSCGSPSMLTIAHVFVNRSAGGLGIKENLAVLCMSCHHHYDNGLQYDQEIVRAKVQTYMYGLYGFPDLNKLKYYKGYEK